LAEFVLSVDLEVLIIDDLAFCIDQLSAMVRERAPDARIEVTGKPEEAAARLAGTRPNLIVAELGLPGLEREVGVGMLARLTAAPILVLDARHDMEALRACALAGASGYVTRSSSRDLVAAAIAVVLAGGRYFPTSDEMQIEPPRLDNPPDLSPRQVDVLDGLMRGQTNLEIGERLGIALPTVKVHVRAVLRALGARNRTEAALLGRSFSRRQAQAPSPSSAD
jgi:DNA-binding NarL/FixJ family response regulator